jgi:hypothetical protein
MVTEASATYTGLKERFYNHIPLHADHSDMVKFTTAEDEGYVSVVQRIRGFAKDACRETGVLITTYDLFNLKWLTY